MNNLTLFNHQHWRDLQDYSRLDSFLNIDKKLIGKTISPNLSGFSPLFLEAEIEKQKMTKMRVRSKLAQNMLSTSNMTIFCHKKCPKTFTCWLVYFCRFTLANFCLSWKTEERKRYSWKRWKLQQRFNALVWSQISPKLFFVILKWCECAEIEILISIT